MGIDIGEAGSDFVQFLAVVQKIVALAPSFKGDGPLASRVRVVEDSHALSELAAIFDQVKEQVKS